MSRKQQNRSNFYTYQNRMYNNDIKLKDINTQKNLVNDHEEKNHYNNLHSNFGENNWSGENHGRDLGEKYNTNRIIKNQANEKQNNYSNNNQPNRNNISPNFNKYGRELGKIPDVNPIIKNQANYRQNYYSNNNQPNRNNISPNYDKYINYEKYNNDNNLNNNLNKENHINYFKQNFNVKPEMKKFKTSTGIGFNNLQNVSIKNNNDNLQQKNIDIVKENKNLEENKKAILNES